ncbi:hypothetical protein V6N13_005114 [Hibiscus sabdariffa]
MVEDRVIAMVGNTVSSSVEACKTDGEESFVLASRLGVKRDSVMVTPLEIPLPVVSLGCGWRCHFSATIQGPNIVVGVASVGSEGRLGASVAGLGCTSGQLSFI